MYKVISNSNARFAYRLLDGIINHRKILDKRLKKDHLRTNEFSQVAYFNDAIAIEVFEKQRANSISILANLIEHDKELNAIISWLNHGAETAYNSGNILINKGLARAIRFTLFLMNSNFSIKKNKFSYTELIKSCFIIHSELRPYTFKKAIEFGKKPYTRDNYEFFEKEFIDDFRLSRDNLDHYAMKEYPFLAIARVIEKQQGATYELDYETNTPQGEILDFEKNINTPEHLLLHFANVAEMITNEDIFADTGFHKFIWDSFPNYLIENSDTLFNHILPQINLSYARIISTIAKHYGLFDFADLIAQFIFQKTNPEDHANIVKLIEIKYNRSHEDVFYQLEGLNQSLNLVATELKIAEKNSWFRVRLKNTLSIHNKISNRNQVFKQIYDNYGARGIFRHTQDMFQFFDALCNKTDFNASSTFSTIYFSFFKHVLKNDSKTVWELLIKEGVIQQKTENTAKITNKILDNEEKLLELLTTDSKIDQGQVMQCLLMLKEAALNVRTPLIRSYVVKNGLLDQFMNQRGYDANTYIKKNQYQSIHINIPAGIEIKIGNHSFCFPYGFELQLRDLAMDKHNQLGKGAHYSYKYPELSQQFSTLYSGFSFNLRERFEKRRKDIEGKIVICVNGRNYLMKGQSFDIRKAKFFNKIGLPKRLFKPKVAKAPNHFPIRKNILENGANVFVNASIKPGVSVPDNLVTLLYCLKNVLILNTIWGEGYNIKVSAGKYSTISNKITKKQMLKKIIEYNKEDKEYSFTIDDCYWLIGFQNKEDPKSFYQFLLKK